MTIVCLHKKWVRFALEKYLLLNQNIKFVYMFLEFVQVNETWKYYQYHKIQIKLWIQVVLM